MQVKNVEEPILCEVCEEKGDLCIGKFISVSNDLMLKTKLILEEKQLSVCL